MSIHPAMRPVRRMVQCEGIVSLAMPCLYKDHVTNEEIRRKIQAAIEEYDEHLTLVKKRKLRWFGLVLMASGSAKTILPGHSERKKKMRQIE